MSFNLNLWISIPGDDHNELRNGIGNENSPLSDIAQRFADGQLDPDVVQNLYQVRTAGPNSWHLWSIILTVEDHNDLIMQVNSFRTEYPGAQVLGLWWPEGHMYGTEVVYTEVPNPDYVGEPEFIPNPDYQPDEELPDYDPREEIKNPAYVSPTIVEKSQTGDPQYIQPNNLSQYMPDDAEGNPDPTLRDVNLPLGWQTRIFT